MNCPECKNKGFIRSKEVPAKTSVYKTDSYSTVTYRYRICLQCGYKWITKEACHKKNVGGVKTNG